MFKNIIFSLILLLAVCCNSLVFAAAPDSLQKDVTTKITAENMTYSADNRQVTFNLDVKVDRPDFQLTSKKLVAYLKAAEKKDDADNSAAGGLAAGDIEKIVATGNVKMTKDGRVGTCTKATYNVDTEILVMEGNPKLSDGENTISGDIIRYYIKENRSEVVGGKKQRVEAIFSTKKSSK